MKRKIITTSDGSKTIFLEDWNEHYHSKHGAIQEANHVYIKPGLLFFMSNYQSNEPISIMEIGFGTGLNAYLSIIHSEKNNTIIDYVGVEAFPILDNEWNALNYKQLLDDSEANFDKIHQFEWNKKHQITEHFSLTKKLMKFEDIHETDRFDIIYFDAFGPRVQPELWTEEIFNHMHQALKHNGILVTYSAKGSVRRAMQSVGFEVEKLQGPPGKREMLRATKHSA